MTLIRKLASVLFLASWLISGSTNSQDLVAGQIYNTQNLTNNSTAPTDTTGTWQNVGLWNQGLPCWGPGGPVYCGPKPYFNNGSVNFSYGNTDLNQVVSIAKALPNTGTGLLVNGFNFGFTAKNGNGWDNAQQDYLKAYVKVFGADGTVAANYDYSNATNRQYNWTTFNFNETFTTPYAAKDLNSVQYGFVGRDTNGWAGPYGPEIININFSLKYSVDPCAKDVLSSPSCPGYMDALGKLTGSSTASPTTTTAIGPATVTVTESPTPTTTTSNTVSGPPPSAVSADVLSKVVETTKTTAVASASAINSSTNLNDKSSVTAFALSVIAKNAANEKTLQEKAVSEALSTATAAATTAVEQSQSIAMSQSQMSAANSGPDRLTGSAAASSGPAFGVSTAPSVPAAGATVAAINVQANVGNVGATVTSTPVAAASALSLLPPAAAPVTNTVQQTGQTGTGNAATNTGGGNTAPPAPAPAIAALPLLPPAPPPSVSVAQPTGQTGSTVAIVNTGGGNVAPPAPAPVATQVNLLPPQPAQPVQAPVQVSAPPVQQNPAQGLAVAISSTPFAATPIFVPPAPVAETPKFSDSENNKNVDMSSPTDFIAGYLNTKHNLNEMQAPMTGPSVNSKTEDNEAAGGVSIATMAKMPPGYDLYTSLSLKDVAFYKSEEVYRGQKNVDNQRLLRGLTGASDRVHQEMVDQQYNKN